MFKPIITSSKPTWYLNTPDNPEKRCGRCDKSTEYALHTWFTWQVALRASKKKGPRGGERLEEFARYVYYKDGRFLRTKTHKRPDRGNTRASYSTYEPINGTIWTVFPRFQARYGIPDATILCRDGYPVAVEIDDEAFTVTPEEWPAMEAFLGLDQYWRK